MYLDDFKMTPNDFSSVGNKLFCTFASKQEINSIIEAIKKSYTILYNKIFILASRETDEFICTYNIDFNNLIADTRILPNTIFAHRNKQTNTLYTIPALNKLIVALNNGKFDRNYRINWNDYRNCILLLRGGEFVCLHTIIHDVVKIF